MTTTHSTRHLNGAAAQAGRRWFIADADGQVLGRLASRIATALRGKNRATFSPHLDTGDFVVVVNAEKIRLTGSKLRDKIYVRHTEYPGGVRRATAEEVLQKHPTRLLREAVEGMLPKNRLGRHLVTKLKVYAGPDHPHEAQRPAPLPER
ncbi:MAG: 50S ribosomal protein L13 [Candidatus Binatia bacterium]